MDAGDVFLLLAIPTGFLAGLLLIQGICIFGVMVRNAFCYISNRKLGTRFKIINIKELL